MDLHPWEGSCTRCNFMRQGADKNTLCPDHATDKEDDDE